MTRYKGRQSAKAVQKEFPYFVDIVVPPGGLGNHVTVIRDAVVLADVRLGVEQC
jgi:hypothetical protein